MKCSKKHKRLIFFTIKLAVTLAAFVYVAIKIYRTDSTGFLSLFDFDKHQNGYFWLCASILLMPIGWFFETLKWRIAINDFEKVSFAKALKTVWYGAGIGLLTPNRIGDPFGRSAMVSPANRVNAGFMAFICSASQQLATVLYGLIGFAIWQNQMNLSVITMVFALIFLLASVGFIVLFTFGAGWTAKMVIKVSLFRKYAGLLNVSKKVTISKIMVIIALSLLRYMVFATQFVLILKCFGFNNSYYLVYAAIFISYLLTSVLPTFALAEVGVRAGFAIVFIGTLWDNPSGITLASLTLWVINVATPGLVGLVWGMREDANELK